jgi:hypothetical protein
MVLARQLWGLVFDVEPSALPVPYDGIALKMHAELCALLDTLARGALAMIHQVVTAPTLAARIAVLTSANMPAPLNRIFNQLRALAKSCGFGDPYAASAAVKPAAAAAVKPAAAAVTLAAAVKPAAVKLAHPRSRDLAVSNEPKIRKLVPGARVISAPRRVAPPVLPLSPVPFVHDELHTALGARPPAPLPVPAAA